MLVGTFSPTALFTTVTVIVVVRLLYRTIHRIFFHALRFAPDPWINSVSELPAAFALVRGEQHIYYRQLHEKYGPIVRMSPGELSFVSVEAREAIYGFRKHGLNMEKSPIFLGAVGNVNRQTGVSLALNQEHSRQRRTLGYLFPHSALVMMEPLLQVHIHTFIATLQGMAKENKSVNCELCVAEPFGCLEQASATEWSTSVINVFVAATYTQAIRRISGVGTWLESFMIWLLFQKAAAAWRVVHLNNSRDKTMRRLADPDREHTDFIYHMLRNESKKSLSQTEIVLNIALFISAGTDTTATALIGWTYFVCTHKAVNDRLIHEVRSALHSPEDIIWNKVKHLRYLDATINEALRLFPPSPASQQRVVPRDGATIHGYRIPAGTTVAVSPWSATRSHFNFRDPDDIRPERWLEEEEAYASDRLGASLPFGTGPRVCIARNLALIEMRLVDAHMLWHYDLALERGNHKTDNDVWDFEGRMKTMKVYHSMTKPPLWVRLEPVRS